MCGHEPASMQVGLNNWNGLGCRRGIQTSAGNRTECSPRSYSRFSMCIFMDSFVYHIPVSDGGNKLKYHQTCKILPLNHEMRPAKCVKSVRGSDTGLFDFWFFPQIHRWIRHRLAQCSDSGRFRSDRTIDAPPLQHSMSCPGCGAHQRQRRRLQSR